MWKSEDGGERIPTQTQAESFGISMDIKAKHSAVPSYLSMFFSQSFRRENAA